MANFVLKARCYLSFLSAALICHWELRLLPADPSGLQAAHVKGICSLSTLWESFSVCLIPRANMYLNTPWGFLLALFLNLHITEGSGRSQGGWIPTLERNLHECLRHWLQWAALHDQNLDKGLQTFWEKQGLRVGFTIHMPHYHARTQKLEK